MRGLIGALLAVGLVVAYWQWVLGAVVVVLIVKAAPIAYREWQGERSLERQRLLGLVARADQQHQWAACGDLRGVHGNYPPAFEGNRTG